jgi:hypothetical protein
MPTGDKKAKGSDDPKLEKVRRSYAFLTGHEAAGTTFTVDDIAAATGWKASTIRTYLKKKWAQIVHKGASGLRASGVSAFSEAEYTRMMSRSCVRLESRRSWPCTCTTRRRPCSGRRGSPC